MATHAIEPETTTAKVLRRLYQTDTSEAVSSATLRRRCGMSNSLLNYHIKKLLEAGMVEKGKPVDIGAPKKANTYRLTHGGRLRAEALIEAHEERIRTEELRELDSNIREVRHRVDGLKERLDGIDERFDRLLDLLKDDYPTHLETESGEPIRFAHKTDD